MRKKPIKSKPIYPIDFTRRTQMMRDGHTYIRYGEPDAEWEARRLQTEREMARGAAVAKLPKNYLSSGRVPLYALQPPSETEHFDLGLQGKL